MLLWKEACVRLHLQEHSQEARASKYPPQVTTCEVSSEQLCPVLGSQVQNRHCQSEASLIEGHQSVYEPATSDL